MFDRTDAKNKGLKEAIPRLVGNPKNLIKSFKGQIGFEFLDGALIHVDTEILSKLIFKLLLCYEI